MSSELRVFDNIPKYLLSPDKELKKQARDLLARELKRREVRRPWSSIEPFIVALYHVTFVDKDMDTGRLLLNYLDKVLPKVKNTLPTEVQEATDIILCAVRAEIGDIDRNSALKYIRSYKTTSLISELVKRVIIIELSGEYDEQLEELLKEIGDKIRHRHWYLKTLLEESAFDDVVKHFFLDLDMTQVIEEPRNMHTIHDYFVHRAGELHKEYEERRKVINPIRIEYEELKQRYDEVVKNLGTKIKIPLIITINIAASTILSMLLNYMTNSLIIAGIIACSGIVSSILVATIEQIRNMIVNSQHVSRIALSIAKRIVKWTREGRNVLKEMKYKERMLKDLEIRMRRFK